MIVDMNIQAYADFVKQVKTFKVYRSVARKQYQVMKANETTFVLRDLRTKEDHEVDARSIFIAMQEFGERGCTVSIMREYVGAKGAQASSALVYWIYRQGTIQASIDILADLLREMMEKGQWR